MTAATMPDRKDEQVFRVTQPDGGEEEVAVAARHQHYLLQNHGVRGVSYRSHRVKGAVQDGHVITLEEAPLHLAKKAGLPMEAAKARILYECQTRRMLLFNRPGGSHYPQLIGTHGIDFGRLPLEAV